MGRPVTTLLLSLLLCLAPVLSPAALALEVPALKARVNDLAGILNPATVQVLETNLALLEREDSTQIAVLTIPTLDGDSLEAFSLRVAERWGLGQRYKDNGALLLIAVQDRKMRIEVGLGLEGRLTDLVSGRIIRHEITPAFRRGDYNQGVVNGVEAMIRAVKGEYSASDTDRSDSDEKESETFFSIFITCMLCVGIALQSNRLLAACVGGFVAMVLGLVQKLMGSASSSSSLLFLAGAGAFVAWIMATFSTSSRSGSSSGGRSRSFGGGSSGGGGSSSGFSGGGGGFGGGGSSGGW